MSPLSPDICVRSIVFIMENSISILMLAAGPGDMARLRLGKEAREISEGLRSSQQREKLTFKQQWAVRPADMHSAMLDVRPDIVHFSGHGEGEAGIVFENDKGEAALVSTDTLAGFFELFAEHVHCVVLNACYSDVQADAIARHIDYVIGMNQAIEDAAAVLFARNFYETLGAGKAIEFAFKMACNSIRMSSLPGHLTPVLKKNPRLQTVYTPPYRHDIFISCAPADDRPEAGAVAGRVTALVNDFKNYLGMKLDGRNSFSLWLPPQNAPPSPELLERLEKSALLLAVVSPNYFGSPRHLDELEFFLSCASKNRVFIIEQNPADRAALPGGLPVHALWRADAAGNAFPLTGFPYYQKLGDLARDMTESLKALKTSFSSLPAETDLLREETSNKETEETSKEKTKIFLAEVSDDLASRHDELKRSLHQHGCLETLPETQYYFPDRTALLRAMDADLQNAALFVQLLSASSPQRPPGMSTPALQYERAQAAGIPILQWRDPALDITKAADPALRSMLETGAVTANNLEEFKLQIVRRLDTIRARLDQEENPDEADKKSAGCTVFVERYRDDQDLAELLCDRVHKRDMLCLFTLEQGDPAALREHLRETLDGCDALLVLYGKSPNTWVRQRLMHALKIVGRRKPKPYIALCELPPEPKDSLAMAPPSYVTILKRDGEPIDLFLSRVVTELETRL